MKLVYKGFTKFYKDKDLKKKKINFLNKKKRKVLFVDN